MPRQITQTVALLSGTYPAGSNPLVSLSLDPTQASVATTESSNTYKITGSVIEAAVPTGKVSGKHDVYVQGVSSAPDAAQTRIDYLQIVHNNQLDPWHNPGTGNQGSEIPSSINNPFTENDVNWFSGTDGKYLWSGGCQSPDNTQVTSAALDTNKASQKWRVLANTGWATPITATTRITLSTNCGDIPAVPPALPDRIQYLTVDTTGNITTTQRFDDATKRISQEWIVTGLPNNQVKLRNSIAPYKYLDYDATGKVLLNDTGMTWKYTPAS